MKSLLVVAHGSRRQASNDEVRALVEGMRARAKGYDRIDCAFLELAEPSIPDGLRTLIGAGSEEVVVLPYFLSAGRHVAADIPEAVDAVRGENPGVRIRLAPYLGASANIPDLMIAQADAG